MGKKYLRDESFSFAVCIIQLYKDLSSNKKEYVLSKQILRSGTSVGAMIREAGNAESRADFVHKLGIAQKECDETMYWLELLVQTDYISENEYMTLLQRCTALLKMIKSSILTSKQNNLRT